MAITLAQLKINFKTKLAADDAAPSIDDVNDASISTWADELMDGIVDNLLDPVHYPPLVVYDQSLSFTSNAAPLPSNFLKLITTWDGKKWNKAGVKVTASKRRCRILEVDDFNRIDSHNFLTTPDDDIPIACVQDKVRVKGDTYTTGYLDYIKVHPAVSGGTKFDKIGDEILVLKMLAEYFGPHLGEHEIALKYTNKAMEMIKNANSKI